VSAEFHSLAAPAALPAPGAITPQTRVLAGFFCALLITLGIGAMAWQSERELVADSGNVVHTFAVMKALQELRAEVIDNQARARGYALSGNEALLARKGQASRC